MRLDSIKGLAAAVVASSLVLLPSLTPARGFGDEPSRLGRLFRMGNSSASASSNPHDHSSSSPTASSFGSATPATAAPGYSSQPALSTPLSTASGSMTGSSAPKVMPKPRVNKPITEADPLVTRISIGRSDNGSQFGMLFQVFADGTIIDGEGVHKVSGEALKPVFDAVASGDLAKLRGHCGGPAGDFIENVHVVVFDRSMGRLRANAFSYSGNPQGCEHAVHQLQKALDELQGKLNPSTASTVTSAPAPGLASPPLPLTYTP